MRHRQGNGLLTAAFMLLLVLAAFLI